MSAQVKTLRKLRPEDQDEVTVESMRRERALSSRRVSYVQRKPAGKCIWTNKCHIEEEQGCPCIDFRSK